MTNRNTDTTGRGMVAVIEILPERWGWIVFSGLLSIAFGLLALFMPFEAVIALTILFGAFAMADGVLSLIAAFSRRGGMGENFWPLLLRGALGVFAGVIILIMPEFATLSLTTFFWVMMALWAFATGLLEIIAAIRLRKEIEGEWMLGLLGLISLGLGVAIMMLLFSSPGAGVVTMGWFVGIYALMHGVVEIALGFMMRRIYRQGL